MIAIATISDTLDTIVARLTPACAGLPRNCARASCAAADRGTGIRSSTVAKMRGSSNNVPSSSRAIAA